MPLILGAISIQMNIFRLKKRPLFMSGRKSRNNFWETKTVLVQFYLTRKYPLRGYILVVLTHTTAWDRLWGGDVSFRLYKCISALHHAAAVWRGFWNSDHVVLKSSIRSSASPCSVTPLKFVSQRILIKSFKRNTIRSLRHKSCNTPLKSAQKEIQTPDAQRWLLMR